MVPYQLWDIIKFASTIQNLPLLEFRSGITPPMMLVSFTHFTIIVLCGKIWLVVFHYYMDSLFFSSLLVTMEDNCDKIYIKVNSTSIIVPFQPLHSQVKRVSLMHLLVDRSLSINPYNRPLGCPTHNRPAALPKPIIILVPRPCCWKGPASKLYVEFLPHMASLGMEVDDILE